MTPQEQESALFIVATTRQLSSYLHNTQDIGRCVQTSKVFSAMSTQMHEHPSVSWSAIHAFNRGHFLKWTRISISTRQQYITLEEWLRDVEFMSDFDPKNEPIVVSVKAISIETLLLRDEYVLSNSEPFSKYSEAYDALSDALSEIFCRLTFMPKLQELVLDLNNCWGVSLHVLANGVELPSVKTLRVLNLSPTSDAGSVPLLRDAYSLPNIETLELLFDRRTISALPFYSISDLICGGYSIPTLRNIRCDRTDFSSLDELFSFAEYNLESLEDIDIKAWCLEEDFPSVDWESLWVLLPRLNSVKLHLNIVGRDHSVVLTEHLSRPIPPSLCLLDLTIVGYLKPCQHKACTVKTRAHYNNVQRSPAFHLRVFDACHY
jgi:hypothetical protein